MTMNQEGFPVFKGLQKPLEFMGIRGRFLTLAALAIGVSFVGFILFSIVLGKLAGFIAMLVMAVIGLVTAFDIKADVLVSLALIASVCIGAIFAAGEVAFIMQLGGLLEELTVAKARAGIEKLVHLTPQTARVLAPGSDDAALYRLAASAEQLSEHPLGKAITASYRQSGGTPMAAAEGFQMVPGAACAQQWTAAGCWPVTPSCWPSSARSTPSSAQ